MSEAQAYLNGDEILATLRELSAGVTTPLWLFGGVAVDFMVGRWTRPHGDIDLNAFSRDRETLTRELNHIGYYTVNTGWLTHWYQTGTRRFIEVVFLEQLPDGKIELCIRDGDPIGVPGHYPIVEDYLDPKRFGELAGVRFRVGSPAGEWLARASGLDVIGGRTALPKLEHDRRLLESLLEPDELEKLRASRHVR